MSVESVVVKPVDNVESPEYIAEMAAKGESAINGGKPVEAPVVIPEKPEGIPDKFYNAETGVVDYASLAKSYVELEKAKGKPPEPPKVPNEAEAPKGTEDDANKAVSDAGLDMASLSKEYQESGELSQESYDKFSKAGITKDTVDDYIEGQKARIEVMRNQAHQITEGADGYAAMIEYAKANLTPEEIRAYNAMVNNRDSKVRDLAIRDMWTRYNADSGLTGNGLITNKTNAKIGSGAYQSRAELMVDMGNPKYKSDSAFRAKVEAKLAQSDIF